VNRAYRELYALEHAPAEFDTMPTFERARLLHLRDATTGRPLPFAETPAGRALRGEVVTGPSAEIRARAFDGRELEVHSSAAPLHDAEADGRVAGAVLVLRDVTWRKQLEREREAAREQAERQADQLDRIFAAAADGLLVWDAEGRIVRENAAARRILGLDAAPPDFCQLPVSERLALMAARDEQDRPVAIEEWPIMRALRGEVETGTGAQTHDIRMRALDGREIEVTLSTAPLWDREGRIVGAVCVLHDQTERRRLERERATARADELAAREASRRLEEFLATAAHDLRTPLSTTIGFLDLAERASERLAAATHEAYPDLAPSVEAVRDRLEDADRSVARLARLLTLLFDTAALRTGKLELHRAPLDLAALVREQVAALRVAAPGRTIRLHTPAAGGLIPVAADADRIGQVVANYVTNALKYALPDRPVDVSVAARGSRARVAVRDQGPGIPAAERARVWEVFHRAPGVAVQGGTKGGTKGSLGLGLHISKAIITAHGGRVGVTSAVGAGSTFWFTLPLSGLMPDRDGAAP
jgi:signal transduction histidine kinase